MADEFHRHARVRIKLFLKWKNTESFSKTAAHQIHAPRPPGPKLRADVVDVSNALRAQLACESEVKTGEIRKNGQSGFAMLRYFNNAAHRPNERWQTLQDFGDAHDGNFRIIGDDLDARGAHLRAAHAEDGDVEALLQSGGEPRGVHVPGSFAGGKKKRNRRHVQWRFRSVARANRGRLRCAASFQGQVQLLLFVLELIQAEVDAALSEKLLVRALLAQAALMEHKDAISVLDGTGPVSNHQGGASREQSTQGFADLQLRFCVHARSGLIEDEEARIVG